MATDSSLSTRKFAADPDDDGPIIARKPWAQSADFDMTAMIDLVFMMNIFFLVTSLTNAMAEVDLPAAKRAVAADAKASVVITLIAEGKQRGVYIGDGAVGEPLADRDQDEAVRTAIEQGLAAGKSTVLIKAEKQALYRDVNRVAAVASAIEGVKLNMAVTERD